MGQSIFNIEQDYLDLLNTIEINEGVISEEEEQLLEITKEDFNKKMDAYRNIILTLESEIALAKDQIARFNSKISAKNNTIERLKAVMLEGLTLFGEPDKKTGNPKLKTEAWTFFTLNKTTVEVDPLKFTLANDKIYPYAKVKLPLELTPQEYLALKGLELHSSSNIDSTKEVDTINIALSKVRDCIITVQPDKKLLTDTLKAQETKGTELPLDAILKGEEQPDTEYIPGVKLVTNTSIQAR